MDRPAGVATFDLDGAYRLHASVALRPEPFGALAYHFGNRRLTFLRSPEMVTVVRSLAHQPSARAALASAGVDQRRWPAFGRALASLAASDMIQPREVDDVP